MKEEASFGGKERRQADRPKVRLRARYRLFDEARQQGTGPVDAEAVDLSLLGLMLRTNEIETDGVALLPRVGSESGPRVELELELDPDRSPLSVTGRVLWLRLSEDGVVDHKYAAGVVFSYMGERDQDALRSYLERRD